MATVKMPTPTDIRQRAITLIEQLPPERLKAVVQLLEFLAQQVQEGTSSPKEANLLQVIQRHLPADEQGQLEDLRDRAFRVEEITTGKYKYLCSTKV